MDDYRELIAPLWARSSISYSELYLTHQCVTWTLIQPGHSELTEYVLSSYRSFKPPKKATLQE
jgi:hypothetical protein